MAGTIQLDRVEGHLVTFSPYVGSGGLGPLEDVGPLFACPRCYDSPWCVFGAI